MDFKRYILILIGVLIYGSSWATHNKAGEITYRRLSGLTYEITITTYTDPRSTAADRCSLPISYGDGKVDTLPRINGFPTPDCQHGGENLTTKVKKNVYRGTHTYAGNGKYVITMEDPNRIQGVQNIPNSVSIPFFLRSVLIIDPLLGSNNSPLLSIPPIDEACLCKPFYHNPGAYDPDGDSLSYYLSVCYGEGGRPIPGYTFPIPSPLCGKQKFELNEVTGTLAWDAAGIQGIYNVCILIVEWRRNKANGRWDTSGIVLRDMQVEVGACTNDPPEFIIDENICVTAGDTLEEVITAYDQGDFVNLTGTGEPLFLFNSPAQLVPPSASAKDTVKLTFRWETQCSHIRDGSYFMQYKAQDSALFSAGGIKLVNFATQRTRVIGPPVINVQIAPNKNAMDLSWNNTFCGNVSGYDVYRKVDSTNWTPASCEVGIPSFLGYQKIASVAGAANTFYTDDNNGIGLFHGLTYCYRIVPRYSSGSEGKASVEVCGELPFSTPIITRNSISTTDLANGTDSIAWAKPQEIDFSVYKPPYSFKVYSQGRNSDPIFESPEFTVWNNIDTVAELTNLNTQDQQQTFKVELISEGRPVGSSHWASSIYLKIGPDDKRLHLTWEQSVPWSNFEYVIFKEIGGSFQVIDTVDNPPYVDSNLVNGESYRYFVRSSSKYSIEEIPDTFLNNSQIAQGIPKDTIPPCPPLKPSIDSDCELFVNRVSWKNPNETCDDKDAVRYNLYYTPIVGGDYRIIREYNDINDTVALFEDLESVAGCYAVTAIDTFDNESALSERVCVDNCPLYVLPNAFTPGTDGYNDFFTPIFPYRYVKDIDMAIYNRWGQLVFETRDPDIRWNGIDQRTNKVVESGVFFYVCTVNEVRLAGIIPRELKGTITVIVSGEPNTNSK